MELTPRLVGLAKGFCSQALRISKYDDDPISDEYSRVERHGLPALRIVLKHAAPIANDMVAADPSSTVSFNRADLRNFGTEAGMSAICAERDCVMHEDFMKAVWKLNEAKRFKSSVHYSAHFGKD
ncbi:hypothetical protein CMV_001316 [Castanea mollissima]|uniref:Uncharacterized protein n=1 Tax=Castanea mollissima TaxID=60419 RepID=A0A8J4RL28_9ROSI|nr:hypothetical protein CMV_001316 [Castanea mollissima]